MAEVKTQKKNYLGTGRRKSAVARVRLSEGTGKIVVNGKALDVFFTELQHQNAVTGPLELTEMRSGLDVGLRDDHPAGSRSAYHHADSFPAKTVSNP